MDFGDSYRKIQEKQLQKRMDEKRRKEMLERMKKQAKKNEGKNYAWQGFNDGTPKEIIMYHSKSKNKKKKKGSTKNRDSLSIKKNK